MSTSTYRRLVGALERADEVLLAALRLVLVALMATMAGAVLLQVFTRYVLAFSLTWSEELARLCFLCLIFLAAACLCRREEHLAVTAVVDLLPPRLRALAMVLVNATGLYCCWYLVRGSFRALGREWTQLTPAMQVPMGLIYSTVFAAIVLMMLWLTLNVLRHGSRALGARSA